MELKHTGGKMHYINMLQTIQRVLETLLWWGKQEINIPYTITENQFHSMKIVSLTVIKTDLRKWKDNKSSKRKTEQGKIVCRRVLHATVKCLQN